MSVLTSNDRLKQLISTTKGSAISTVAVTLVMVVLMIFLAILPAYRSITDQLKNNEAKETYLQQLQIKKNTLDKLGLDYEDNIDKINFFNKYNSSTLDTETFLANIDALAKSNKAKLTNISIAENSSYSAVAESPFIDMVYAKAQELSMTFRLQLNDVAYLVNSLEKFPLTIYIQSMEITQQSNNTSYSTMQTLNENGLVELDIKGEIYFWNNSSL
jgi:hypothetical protein